MIESKALHTIDLENSQFLTLDSQKVADVAVDPVLKSEPVVRCPNCDSVATSKTLSCPNCRGTSLVGGDALQHLRCLNFDFESNFLHHGDAIFCPKCNRELLELGSDYLKPGAFFKCQSCGEFTARALSILTCDNCQMVFEGTKSEIYKKAVEVGRSWRRTESFNKGMDNVPNPPYASSMIPIVSLLEQGSGDSRGASARHSKLPRKGKTSRKRSSFDIMADILTIVTIPSSKTEIMACANLSYDQCRKYLPALGKLGLIAEDIEDGLRPRFGITQKGREYLSNMSSAFGSIADGDKSVWSTRRRPV